MMLDHYKSILAKKALPYYLETKTRCIKADLKESEAVLWEAHDRKEAGEVSLLDVKIEIATRILSHCEFCERRCGVNRPAEQGNCTVREPRIASEFAHYGEESVLVPSHTIFFSGCNFHCVYCQNWDISQVKSGTWIPPKKLAKLIEYRHLQNMNFVGGDPTPNLDYILQVLRECEAHIPVVWNSNMYLTEESMRLLEGVVDVYLTDFKYGNDTCAGELSDVSDYFAIVSRNHLLGEQHADLIIRHLVLPGHLECCTRPVLQWISENLKSPAVNVMFQYHPEYRAMENARIDRYLTYAEKQRVLEIAQEFTITLV
ncbi:MAG: radical SAM protein [Theionarchaea archaeon]|nr:radical SAM protein [Theionarchaea archaeon]MBU7034825.1 radical SAM protein [Theionarchaea archaeon]